MDGIKSKGFISFMSHRLIAFQNRLINMDKRKIYLYLTCFIFIIIVIIVFVLLFIYSSISSDEKDEDLVFDNLNVECLKSHNFYRSLHGASPLQLSHQVLYMTFN
jgi:phosphotransferase system  glucose/maltose/N-acetylglucosamine-specific IIC component